MDEQLFKACRVGDFEFVKRIFANGVSVGETMIAFDQACSNGQIHIGKWLIKILQSIDLQAEKAFHGACLNGHLRVAKWLLKIRPSIDVRARDDYAFRCACTYGYLSLAKWLLKVRPSIDVNALRSAAFIGACHSGHLNVAKWLFDFKPRLHNLEYLGLRHNISRWLQKTAPEVVKLNGRRAVQCISFFFKLTVFFCLNSHFQICMQNELIVACKKGDFETVKHIIDAGHPLFQIKCAFHEACFFGHLDIVQFLCHMFPSIVGEFVFRSSCFRGHLHVARWLLKENPSIDVHAFDNVAFRWSCDNGQLHVAKWLFKLRPSIDEHAHDDEAFREACTYGHLHIAKWLIEVRPSIGTNTLWREAFHLACHYNQLKVAKWILSKRPRIARTCNNAKFRGMFSLKCLVLKWLQRICPDFSNTETWIDKRAVHLVSFFCN
jgi:ankyrin repeat protein